MNVGSMGNGKFAPEDMQILQGMGKWMKVNSDAIYATERTPLPVQPWGTSSKKGTDLHLFVFDQPPGGTLIVDDLQSDPKFVTLMGGGVLQTRRIDADHVQIALPAAARKTEIPVVKVTFDGEVKTGGALPLSVKGVGGGTIESRLGDRALQAVVETGETTPDLHNGDVITREIGTIEVPAGRDELSINALKIPANGELARFNGVTLTPMK